VLEWDWVGELLPLYWHLWSTHQTIEEKRRSLSEKGGERTFDFQTSDQKATSTIKQSLTMISIFSCVLCFCYNFFATPRYQGVLSCRDDTETVPFNLSSTLLKIQCRFVSFVRRISSLLRIFTSMISRNLSHSSPQSLGCPPRICFCQVLDVAVSSLSSSVGRSLDGLILRLKQVGGS
jgi:hypothetical protein